MKVTCRADGFIRDESLGMEPFKNRIGHQVPAMI